MPKSKPRLCKRCGTALKYRKRSCDVCGATYATKRFVMTPRHISAVKMQSNRKGLIFRNDDSLYRDKLAMMGVASCKELNQRQFRQFMSDLDHLPNVAR